jgi:hypothetical protein
MRRPPPTVGLKPSLLRHFLIISIGLTSCLAIFANGENAEIIQDQIKQRQAQNQVLAADKSRGRVKVVGGLQIAKGTNIEDGGGEPSEHFTDSNSSGAASQYVAPTEQNQITVAAADAGPAGAELIAPGGSPPAGKRKPKTPPKLSGSDIERILAASRARSGEPASE